MSATLSPIAADPFAASQVPPTEPERTIEALIQTHLGRKNPISIARIHACTGYSERLIKATVHELIVAHKLRIGASRTEPIGYFLIQDAEDLAAAVGPYRDQIFSMMRRLRVLMDPHALRELLGQLALGSES